MKAHRRRRRSGILHACGVLLVWLWAMPLALAARDRELGIVNYYAKYEANTPSRTESYRARQERAFAQVRKLVPTAEWVDVDIFLRDGAALRARYRRLLLPGNSDTFTAEMYDGMAEYVHAGGLLITCVAGVIEDRDGNYRHDNSDPVTRQAAESFLGVSGVGGAQLLRMRVNADSPLTRGLAVGAWIDLPPRLYGRTTRNVSASVLATAIQTEAGREAEIPFLTVKNTGRGACVYLVGGLDFTADSPLGTLTRNALSAETLAAFCLP